MFVVIFFDLFHFRFHCCSMWLSPYGIQFPVPWSNSDIKCWYDEPAKLPDTRTLGPAYNEWRHVHWDPLTMNGDIYTGTRLQWMETRTLGPAYNEWRHVHWDPLTMNGDTYTGTRLQWMETRTLGPAYNEWNDVKDIACCKRLLVITELFTDRKGK